MKIWKWLVKKPKQNIITNHSWEDLVVWWNSQYPRWKYIDEDVGRCIDGGKYDIILNGELRQRIAPFLQKLLPEQRICAYCQWPWDLIEPHRTMIDENRFIYPLCESCWSHLQNYGQKYIIKDIYWKRLTRKGNHSKLSIIEENLDKDLGINDDPEYDNLKWKIK